MEIGTPFERAGLNLHLRIASMAGLVNSSLVRLLHHRLLDVALLVDEHLDHDQPGDPLLEQARRIFRSHGYEWEPGGRIFASAFMGAAINSSPKAKRGNRLSIVRPNKPFGISNTQLRTKWG